MQSKRDQLQAHTFVSSRLRSALLRGDAELPHTPTRRASTGLFAGSMIGIVVLAIAGVIGFLHPGDGSAWRKPGTIIVEKGTGARFLLLDGALRPLANLTSARLLVGAKAPVSYVSTDSLRGIPQGPSIGIAGAPDSLPDPATMGRMTWQVCARGASGGADDTATTDVLIDQVLPMTKLAASIAPTVRTPDGTYYLIWSGHRLRIPESAAIVALGLDHVTPVQVTSSWVNALPPGPDLIAPRIPDVGRPGPSVAGQAGRIGQVFAAQSLSDRQTYYVLLEDGLSPVSQVAATLLLASQDTRPAYPGVTVAAILIRQDQVAAAPRSTHRLAWSDLPESLPAPFHADETGARELCVSVDAHPGRQLRYSLVTVPAAAVRGARLPGSTRSDFGDVLTVAPSHGALVAGTPVSRGSTVYLLTELGIKFPLVGAKARSLLGFGALPVVPAPAILLSGVPTGPALDPGQVAAVPRP